MTALGKDKRFGFEQSDAGRARLMKFLAERVADMRTRLPRAFATLVPGSSRSSAWRRKSSPVRRARTAARAPSTARCPGKFWINLHDMSVWTTYNTPTLTYHESLPGHVWQGEYTFKLPLCRSLLAFNAYSEGWALYAEQLADELGVYERDPCRPARLSAVDRLPRLPAGGRHRVARQALDARSRPSSGLPAPTARASAEVTGEVDRYCAWPGQACGYKVGHSEINRLRAQAQAALGARFDLRQFNDAVVTGGGVPMLTLARTVGASFIAS